MKFRIPEILSTQTSEQDAAQHDIEERFKNLNIRKFISDKEKINYSRRAIVMSLNH
jgi:hypothetical protein